MPGTSFKTGIRSGKGILFVIDKSGNKNTVIFEREEETMAMRGIVFKNLQILDIDQDGFNETMYSNQGWWISGGNETLYLYVPKYNEWFTRQEQSEHFPELTTTISYSDNLEKGEYKIFKDFLEKEPLTWAEE